MPRWMAAATKRGKAKKEDFLISNYRQALITGVVLGGANLWALSRASVRPSASRLRRMFRAVPRPGTCRTLGSRHQYRRTLRVLCFPPEHRTLDIAWGTFEEKAPRHLEERLSLGKQR